MKYKWKKTERDLYIPKETPMIITVPKQKFFAIKGKGNPNAEDVKKAEQFARSILDNK